MIKLLNTDYKENKGEFDLCLFDPPFNIWHTINFIPKAKNYVCFTNFQNRHHVEKLFGKPKFEMIWFFKDGRWVSHNMPRHTHEHILIYGDLKNNAYTGEYNIDRKPIKKGKGCIGTDKNLGDRLYIPKERKMLNSVIEVPRNVNKTLGVWGKPEKLIMPILEWLVNENDNVWDGFMGSGTFGVCVKNLNANYFGSELNKQTFEVAKIRINNNNQIKIKL
tara:strand:- start:494 stop:1153 length:660 start_codon:yes stop_codon:yes gene_type:complete